MNNTLLAYAFNSDKKLVHIDSVKNGLECNCTCPGCKERLIAKNDGKVREHHFAHTSGNDCGTGYQTIHHIWGKEILFEKKVLPTAIDGNKILPKANSIGMEVHLQNFKIIPDVLGEIKLFNNRIQKNIPCIVEILVTHKVDEEKVVV